ncbi:MAG: tetratricopeptide repeat protein [Gammaproteobacteria bacterium]|nr:tetratricopeptide repeat protein [Gammaproteobacteria bacterium]
MSVVGPESNRSAIENELGGPDETVKSGPYELFVYNFGLGFSAVKCPSGDGLAISTLGILAAPGICGDRGHMVIAYGETGTPVYASRLAEDAETRNKQLADIVRLYALAQRGDVDALSNLSDHAKFLSMEVKLLRIAANTGSAKAQYKFAFSLDDKAKKIDMLRKAAAQGYTPAQATLGAALLYAPDDLVDRTEAKVWLTKAADAGNSYAKTELAKLSEFETNLASAEQGDQEAQYALGQAYASGMAVREDKLQAHNWWRQAAQNSHPPAQLKMAIIYFSGDGVKADIAIATEWARKAEEHNDPDAAYQLANSYRIGPGPKNKMREAVRLYDRAASMGHRTAPAALATMYRYGEGIERDMVRAYMWYFLVASRYQDTAATSRDFIAKEMTPTQIAEAERLAREWLKTHPQ